MTLENVYNVLQWSAEKSLIGLFTRSDTQNGGQLVNLLSFAL
jgi:hypothetical protein